MISWSAGLLLAVTLGLITGNLALTGALPGEIAVSTWLGISSVLAAVIVLRSGSRVGWLLQVGLATTVFATFMQAFARHAIAEGDTGALATSAAWLSHWLIVPGAGLFLFVFLLFPDGRLPGPRWRPAAWSAGVGLALMSLAIALNPGPLEAIPSIRNPAGIEGAGGAFEAIETIGSLLLLGAVIAALAGLVVRMRRARGDERQQIKWLLFSAGVLVAGGFFALVTEGALNELSFVGLLIGLFAVPAALTVALTKYRLYDIDLVVNRALVYSILTAAVVVLYILLVGAMGALLQRRVGLVPALVATGVVAVIFQPLRRVLQSAVDRMMFGQRHDPYGALSNLAGRLESTFDPEEVLPTIVSTVTRSLKLSYAAIEVRREGVVSIAASEGSAQTEIETTPLVYQGEAVGRLLVAPARGDSLTPTDRRLLGDLARSAGAAVHAVALTDELRRSRNELLVAREEERRRLRRDLHDGLGPELAGIALGVGAAVNLSNDADPEVRDLLEKIRIQADGATRSIRSLVEGLRPSALDDLGLIEAIREKGSAIATRGGMSFDVIAPSRLPALSAAVEVAALRIALEAVTNAVRHSGGSGCTVSLSTRQGLELTIEDDGAGIPPDVPKGFGLTSMQERAEQLGGSVTYESSNRGTVVRAVLPLP